MDGQELTRLIGRFGGTVFRAACCCTRNREEAEDITQDVFFALFGSENEFHGDEHIKAWLLRAVINRSRNYFKSSRVRLCEPIEQAADTAAEPRREDALLPLIRTLKPKIRAALYLYYYEDYSVRETAEILHTTKTAVTSRLSRGREQLRKLLIKEGFDEF